MLHFLKMGQGNNQIVFIHGNSQSLNTWDLVMNNPSLTKEFELFAVDLPGHGKSLRSNHPEKDYSLKGAGKHFIEFINNKCVGKYVIVTNSLGANIVGEIAGELINCKGIMLTGSCAFSKQLTLDKIFMPNPNIGASFSANPTDELLDLMIDEVGVNLTALQKKKIKEDFVNTDPVFRTFLADAIGNSNYADELLNLEKSKIPTAVVFGEQEKICFTNHLDLIPFPKWKNKTYLVPKAGHFIQIDQPTVLASIILEFSKDCFN